MITDIQIKNFKCFKNLIIPELGRITLISGKNNVGKTALLEAIFLFLDQRNPGMVLNQYSRRGIRHVLSATEAIWGPMFRNYDTNSKILISLKINDNSEQVTYQFNKNFAPLPSPEIKSEKQQVSTNEEFATPAIDAEYTIGSGKKFVLHYFCDSNNQNRLSLQSKTTPANILLPGGTFLPSKEHIQSKEIADRFSELAKQDRENEAVEFLRIIEPRLETLKIITEGPNSFVHGKLNGVPKTIPVNLMGEGMEKLLSLIVSIVHSRGHVVFLDEIENGIHYSVLSKVWEATCKAARKYDCQLIATTHSYECLKAAHDGLADMPEDFRYIRLHRKDDEISAKLSNYEMIGTAIKTNLEVR
ncbi:MAG: AAA family ATPase [Anaerohalosphaeraceae bacterium]|nr:AAA family ATPase [Anaerohalosphaeraceae bacterium]